MSEAVGSLQWISEFVVGARLQGSLRISEQVWIGDEKLTAEVIALEPDQATIQVYEDTTGLRPGAPVDTPAATPACFPARRETRCVQS